LEDVHSIHLCARTEQRSREVVTYDAPLDEGVGHVFSGVGHAQRAREFPEELLMDLLSELEVVRVVLERKDRYASDVIGKAPRTEAVVTA
jgi:hypothetical protein